MLGAEVARLPWYEYVARGAVLAVALLIVTRIAGKRFVGEISPVDVVVAISVGTIAGSSTITASVPLWAGLLALATWGAFEWVSVWLSSRHPSMERILIGSATTLAQDGEVRRSGLHSAMLSPETLASLLRARGVDDLSEVRAVYIEPSGKIGLEKPKRAKAARPALG